VVPSSRRKALAGEGRGWVYKVNANAPSYASAWGDWDDFFDSGIEDSWGGSWATGNAESRLNFDDLRPGDRIWAYQTASPRRLRGRRLVGIAEVVRLEPSKAERGETDLILRPIEQFDPGVLIHEAKQHVAALKRASAFKPGHAGTLYALQPDEHRALVEVVLTQ
jgi:hypothetical protein